MKNLLIRKRRINRLSKAFAHTVHECPKSVEDVLPLDTLLNTNDPYKELTVLCAFLVFCLCEHVLALIKQIRGDLLSNHSSL